MSESPKEPKEPAVVYHYTSMDVLTKIVDCSQIWTTSVDYLNDTREREHFLRLAKPRVPIVMAQNPKIAANLFEFLTTSDRNKTSFDKRPFVASFCVKRDALTQWRSYCPGGNGVSIGFRVSALQKASISNDNRAANREVSSDRVTFESVKYLSSLDEEWIDAALTNAAQAVRYTIEDIEDDPEAFMSTSFARRLMGIILGEVAVLSKHYSFRSEREYRLVLSAVSSLLPLIKYRPTRSTLLPHIPLHLENPVSPPLSRIDGLKDSFIESVTIGPSPLMKLSVQSVEGLFKNKGLNVRVNKSKVPYRDM